MSLVPDYIFMQNLYPVTSTCFFTVSSGDFLITGDEKGIIKLWDLVSYKKTLLLEAHDTRIMSIQSDSDRKLILTQSRGEIKIWNYMETQPATLELTKIYQSSVVSLSNCCLLSMRTGNYLLACCSTSDSNIADLHHSDMDSVIPITSQSSNQFGLLMVMKLVYTKDPNQVVLLTGYESGILKCDNIKLDINEKIISVKDCHSLSLFNDMITSIDFDSLSSKGVCGSVNSKLIIFTINDLDCEQFKINIVKSIDIGNEGISSITIRPDYRLFCVSCWDSRVKLFSWKTFKLLAVLDKHKQSINSISFSKKLLNCSKMLLAISSKDKTVSLWSPYSEKINITSK
ncbi:guanine nucleotide-binding protein subunit beta-like protein 1 [Panonychus citri]|uniref:guanine nucleotide-binding protein subunit beta-like protein 1 n=1 Tax=Panonychus citri TaxID=50023 RepID=UPI002307EE57|nr:guanine nucleotide-binding protein subunit beta-like protein 1 [Panonychus citri]